MVAVELVTTWVNSSLLGTRTSWPSGARSRVALTRISSTSPSASAMAMWSPSVKGCSSSRTMPAVKLPTMSWRANPRATVARPRLPTSTARLTPPSDRATTSPIATAA